MADVSEEAKDRKTTGIPDLVNPWVTLIGGILATLGVIWAVTQYFSPLKDLDLTVIVEDKVDFSLPEQASSLQKLVLTYDGKPIQRISLVRLSVLNTGNRAIKPPVDSSAKDWTLILRSSTKTPLVQVGDLVRTPEYLEVTPASGPGPDATHLKLKVLNPKESIGMQVALIDADRVFSLPVKAETPEPRVPDLNVAVAERSVRNRIFDAFATPLWVLAMVIVGGWWIVDVWRGRVPLYAGPFSWKVALGTVGAVVLLAFGSVFLAMAASWVLSWIVYLVAFR